MIRRGNCSPASILMVLLALIRFQSTAFAQVMPVQPGANADAKIAAIMDDVLKRGEGHAEGQPNVKTYTWIPPSPEDLKRVQEIGHDAIAPLSKALELPYTRPFQRTLAVTLLEEIGGADIVPPLKRALESNNPNSVRVLALAALTRAPNDLALPIVRNAVHDSDPAVAQRARELLTDYYQVDIP